MSDSDKRPAATVDCLEFRRRVGAEPRASGSALETHERECASCGAFAHGYRELDTRLAEAARFDVARVRQGARQGRAARTPMRPSGASHRARPAYGRTGAAAAGVLLAVIVAAGLLVRGDRPAADAAAALAAEIARHVEMEPEAWDPERGPVAPGAIANVMARSGAREIDDRALGIVTYVEACLFRGRVVAHFAIRGAQGPVVLLLLAGERVTEPQPIETEGYRGVVLPIGGGSAALVTASGEPLEPLMERVQTAVAWN